METLLESGRIVRLSFLLANFGLMGSLVNIVGSQQSLTSKLDHVVVTVFGWIVIVGLGLVLQKALEITRDYYSVVLRPRRMGFTAINARLHRHAGPRRW